MQANDQGARHAAVASQAATGGVGSEGALLRVTADDRERDPRVRDALAACPGVCVRVERLALGDYDVAGRLLVERKTLADFAASVVDGRLFRQAIRLANAARPAVLILEGTAADLAAVGMRREALQGALISVSLVLGVPVLRATGPEETARLMLYAAQQVRRQGWRGGGPGAGRRARGKAAAQVRVLCALPGVGAERARRLIARFGSVEAVVHADAAALCAVPGVGPGTAQRIRWAVGEAAGVYQAGAAAGWAPATCSRAAVPAGAAPARAGARAGRRA